MSQSDKDLNIPNLGPAEPETLSTRVPVATPLTQPMVSSVPAMNGSNGPGFVVMGVLILLVISSVGLGYGYLELQKQLIAKSDELAVLKKQVDDYSDSLKLAQSSAVQSGQSLDSQVDKLTKSADIRTKKVDSEIAKLWTVAYQRNKPQLENQQKSLEQQQKSLEQQQQIIDQQAALATELQKSMASIDSAVTTLTSELDKAEAKLGGVSKLANANAELGEKLPAMRARFNELEKKYKALLSTSSQHTSSVKLVANKVAAIKTEWSTQSAIFSEQLSENSDRISRVQKLAESSGKASTATAATRKLGARVSSNEEALRAFDGTRRQLNSELFKLRKKLNNLQLKIEKIR